MRILDDPAGLGDVIRRLIRRWPLMLAGAVAGGLLGALISWVSPPQYRAEVLLVPVKHGAGAGGLGELSSQIGGLASLAGVALGGGLSETDSSVAMLKSRVMARQLITEENLLPVLFAKKWDSNANRWKPQDADDIPTLWDAERLFGRKVRRVDEDRRTGLLTVSVVWEDPELAARWATQLVSLSDSALRTRAIETARGNIEYLEKQLVDTNVVELRQSIYRLVEDQMKELMLAQGGAEYAFKVLDPAVVPEDEVGPKLPVLLAGGVLLGLLISLSLALLLMRPRAR